LIEESAQKLINQYSELLKQSGFETSEVKKQQYCFEVVVKKNKDLLKLLVYFGKKGTKAILQGNEESELYAAVKTILFGDELFQIKKSELIEPDEYIGTDESGKGDYFGPLVIAGVYINADIKKELLKLGVKDSKQLTDDAIKKIAARVKHIKELKYNIVIINPARYNQLYNEIKNVNKLLAWGHSRVLENLCGVVNAKEAISDKFGDESLIKDRLMTKGQNITLHQTTKGERYTAVAAASILARDKFVDWFDKQENEFKINLPKGASSAAEEAAKALIKNFGKNYLAEVAKLHFKTTTRIIG
jgi:ribonuclease HIII